MHIKVKNNEVIGNPICLLGSYVTDTGSTICGIEHLSDAEKIALGLYPVIDLTPAFNTVYQYADTPVFTVKTGYVEVVKAIKNVKPTSQHIEQRLADFGSQKDIDIEEVGILLQSQNPVWQSEAVMFSTLYVATWQVFYDYTGDSWQELESTLPILSWG